MFALGACLLLTACWNCKYGGACADCSGTTPAAPAENPGTPNDLDAQEISPAGDDAWGEDGADVTLSSSSGGADATDGDRTALDLSCGDAIGIGDADAGISGERSLNDASSNCPAARPLQQAPCDFSMIRQVCLYSYAAVCPISRCVCAAHVDLAIYWVCETLLRLVRSDVAKELMFTGRVVSGEEAARIGLATRVCADPLADARELARAIAAQSPDAIRACKKLCDRAPGLDVAAAFLFETELQRGLLGTPNQIEAAQATMSKRPAHFED